MTIIEQGKQLRSEVAKLRPDKRRRYGVELRRRILDWVSRAGAIGVPELECSKAIGVKTWRFTLWRRIEARSPKPEPELAPEPLALVPIEMPVTLPMHSGISVVAPSGYRVEGLALDQVAALLREFA